MEGKSRMGSGEGTESASLSRANRSRHIRVGKKLGFFTPPKDRGIATEEHTILW